MTAGKPVSPNFYPNNANTNGVALEPNSPKATKNEKRINEKRINETDSFQASTSPLNVATSKKAPPPHTHETPPQGISPLMVGAGMLTTLLVGASAVWIAGSNNWIKLGQKAKTTVTEKIPKAVAQFLNVRTDATDEVIIKAIEGLQNEKAALKQELKNSKLSNGWLSAIPVGGERMPINLPSFQQSVSELPPLAVTTTVNPGATISFPLTPTSDTKPKPLKLPSLGSNHIQKRAENVVLTDESGNHFAITVTESKFTISNEVTEKGFPGMG